MWKPRFSLKLFFIASIACGVVVGWVAQNYRQFQTEKQLIEVITQERSPDGLAMIETNGELFTFGNDFR